MQYSQMPLSAPLAEKQQLLSTDFWHTTDVPQGPFKRYRVVLENKFKLKQVQVLSFSWLVCKCKLL